MPRIVKSILLVEPEGILAEITAFRLELLGYKVEVVSSPDEALKSVSTLRPDMIITDLVLDGASALGLVESLTSREDTKDIPIMVLSLDADLDRVTTVHKAGASEFLVVPFQPEVLQEKVSRLLARPREKVEEKVKVTV